MKALVRNVVLMGAIVLPVTAVLVAGGFALDPRETASFTELLDIGFTQVLLGPSVLALLIALLHPLAVARFQARTTVPLFWSSLLVGAVAGLAGGLLWSVFVAWKAGTVLLGLFAGLAYGLLWPKLGASLATASR